MGSGAMLETLRADLLRLSACNGSNEATKVKWFNLMNPRFTPVLIIRLSRSCYLTRWLRPLSIALTWLNVILFGVECTARCSIGPGLMLPHTSGTVIGASLIGENATIFQGVTLGAVIADFGFDPTKRPTIGDNVTIGAGAKILGGVHVASRATIGANAVVLMSIPEGAVAVGVPAKIVNSAML
jgi:serine O-acetyltransferase